MVAHCDRINRTADLVRTFGFLIPKTPRSSKCRAFRGANRSNSLNNHDSYSFFSLRHTRYLNEGILTSICQQIGIKNPKGRGTKWCSTSSSASDSDSSSDSSDSDVSSILFKPKRKPFVCVQPPPPPPPPPASAKVVLLADPPPQALPTSSAMTGPIPQPTTTHSELGRKVTAMPGDAQNPPTLGHVSFLSLVRIYLANQQSNIRQRTLRTILR